MSTPTNEPLGNAEAGPSTTKDVEVEDSSTRYGKRPEELQQLISSIATELQELVNRQDQLLLLLRKSVKLQNPLTQRDDELRPDDSDPNHPNLELPDPDELEDNERFTRSFHVDVTLDDVKLEETIQETVNLFLTEFQIEGLGCYSTLDKRRVPPTALAIYGFARYRPAYHMADASTPGSKENPTLLLESLVGNGPQVINIQWGQLRQKGSGGNAADVTKLVDLLRTRWQENILAKNDYRHRNYEFKLLNYDIDRYPRYLDVCIFSTSPLNIIMLRST
jgi:hypothetical protein